MNRVATVLGISLPLMKARDAAMAEPKLRQLPSEEPFIFPHQDSFHLRKVRDLKDDDTASTVSTSDDSSFSSSLSVSFAEPLVTEVHVRPYTTKEEKRVLFYTEREFYEFRRDYFYGRNRNRVVSFADSVVSNVWEIPPVVDASKVFYSESELQQFLDEFVASLDKGIAGDL